MELAFNTHITTHRAKVTYAITHHVVVSDGPKSGSKIRVTERALYSKAV